MRHIILKLTPLEFEALNSLVVSADNDGDHQDWLRSAGSPKEAKACKRIKRKIEEAATAYNNQP